MSPVQVLIVDDERAIRRFLSTALTTQGYGVTEAGSVKEALQQATATPPGLVVLDLGLPDGDGLEVIKALREWTQIPIIVLSVRGQEAIKVACLDAGADDYLTKPFSTGELLARMRVALRRVVQAEPEPIVQTGELRIDLGKQLLTRGAEEIHLTKNEWALLKVLAEHVGKVLTHCQLLELVWGPEYAAESHLLRVNISNLRRKIEPEPVRPVYLVTEPGVGYRLRLVEA